MKNFCTVALAAGSLFSLSTIAVGANLTAPQAVQVTSISGSRSTANGYFLFTTSTPVAGCESGFWLPTTDATHAPHLARVNAALISKSALLVSGDRDQVWAGSTDRYCRLMHLQ